MTNFKILTLIEVHFDQCEFGTIVCDNETLCYLPEGAILSKKIVHSVYKSYCDRGSRVLSSEDFLDLVAKPETKQRRGHCQECYLLLQPGETHEDCWRCAERDRVSENERAAKNVRL